MLGRLLGLEDGDGEFWKSVTREEDVWVFLVWRGWWMKGFLLGITHATDMVSVGCATVCSGVEAL